MTYVTDPIGDLLTRFRNAQHVRRETCRAPWSRMKQELCELLKREGYLADCEVLGDAPHQELEVTFSKDKPELMLKRMSKPGQRQYRGSKDLRPVMQGFGLAVLTTSEGLLTDKEARKRNIGGELLCTIA